MASRKLISVDIETSGLDYKKCSILSIGAVVINLDTKQKEESFYGVLQHKSFYGEPYALMLNSGLIKEIAEKDVFSHFEDKLTVIRDEPEKVLASFLEWLEPNKEYSVVGKNFAVFDLRFFEEAYRYNPFNRRILDVGSMYYDVNTDSKIPNLSECLDKAGMNNVVTHNALEDAQQVADLVLYKLDTGDKFEHASVEGLM